MSAGERENAVIYLNGCFRIETAGGDRVPLTSAKAQALVAMLATSAKSERSRQWLQSKLWSDRSAEQAAGSLRQALTVLRKVLSPAGIVLDADRQRVWLDPASVCISREGRGDFLEGLDVGDQEFEDWLRTRREALRAERENGGPQPAAARPRIAAADPVRPRDRVVLVEAGSARGEAVRWFEDLVADAIARSLRELFSCEVRAEGTPPDERPALRIHVQSLVVEGGAMLLRLTLRDHGNGRWQWAGHCTIPAGGAPPVDHPETLRLVNQLIEALADCAIAEGGGADPGPDPDDADLLCRLAIRNLFGMTPEKVARADGMFARAHQLDPRGLHLAWRAQLRAIQRVEKHRCDLDTMLEEGAFFAARALELEPNNSMVLATVANARCHLMRDPGSSLDLARRSVMLNPANPMAWWALSSANVYSDRLDEAYRSAQNAHRLALLSPHRFWWDNQLFGAALMRGEFDEALRHCENARAQNPDFRPPLRYLVAFYAQCGREEDALRMGDLLRTLEPDFTIDRLVRDPAYPASLIHRARGLDVARLAALA